MMNYIYLMGYLVQNNATYICGLMSTNGANLSEESRAGQHV